MNENYYITAQEIASITGRKEGYGYKVIRELNKELEEKGYRIVGGRTPRQYFNERYGIGDDRHE
ncbi:DNA-binding protein [Peptostreptococcus canis]|uniref:DNA-binding protein n=1 Tax=Peptostreptococcus canis TaxID=1159213 RepID=A0ABR6TMB9_9FIRM|nr:DNA-binding protein [Peptostreptococcus canis]MBC2576552.1 DNA-binding protein [Peptostreptococcus canis]MBP1998738.1 hypothetical protein [Peptostreptococcus canis]